MTWGLFGARADRRGLAAQTWRMAQRYKPDRVLGIRARGDQDWHRWRSAGGYDYEVHHIDDLTDTVVSGWLAGLDVVYLPETDYTGERPVGSTPLRILADAHDVEVIVHVNPELYPWHDTPDAAPHVHVYPSGWERLSTPLGPLLPTPPDPDAAAATPDVRSEARMFLHIVGNPAIYDRAGTSTVLAAAALAPDINVHVFTQQPLRHARRISDNVSMHVGDVEKEFRQPMHEVLGLFDVLVQPRRYGGQSLVLDDARQAGLPVIVLDRYPDSELAGPGGMCLLSTMSEPRDMKGGTFDVHYGVPDHLATSMKALASSPSIVEDMSRAQLDARGVAEEVDIGWRNLLRV